MSLSEQLLTMAFLFSSSVKCLPFTDFSSSIVDNCTGYDCLPATLQQHTAGLAIRLPHTASRKPRAQVLTRMKEFRLEVIKHQILDKLGLAETPNITQDVQNQPVFHKAIQESIRRMRNRHREQAKAQGYYADISEIISFAEQGKTYCNYSTNSKVTVRMMICITFEMWIKIVTCINVELWIRMIICINVEIWIRMITAIIVDDLNKCWVMNKNCHLYNCSEMNLNDDLYNCWGLDKKGFL